MKCFARSLDQFLDPLNRMRQMHAQLRITVQSFEGLQDSHVRKTEHVLYERLIARFTSSILLLINRKNRIPLVTHHTVSRYKEDMKLCALPTPLLQRAHFCVSVESLSKAHLLQLMVFADCECCSDCERPLAP